MMCLRQRRSAAWLGGAQSGRGVMIGLLRLQGIDPATLFTGEGHAPAPLFEHEALPPEGEIPESERWNLPDWLAARFSAGLEDEALQTAQALCGRAPVTLRVNTLKTDASSAILMLNEAGIEVQPNPLSLTALTVTQGARRIRNAPAYLQGHVELQDASSQAVVDALPARCSRARLLRGRRGQGAGARGQRGHACFCP